MCIKCITKYAEDVAEHGPAKANQLLGDAEGISRWPAAGVVERRQLEPGRYCYSTTQYGYTLRYESNRSDLKLRPAVFTMPGQLGITLCAHDTGEVYAQNRYDLSFENLLDQQGTGVDTMTFEDTPGADEYVANLKATHMAAMMTARMTGVMPDEAELEQINMERVYRSSAWLPQPMLTTIDGTTAPLAETHKEGAA